MFALRIILITSLAAQLMRPPEFVLLPGVYSDKGVTVEYLMTSPTSRTIILRVCRLPGTDAASARQVVRLTESPTSRLLVEASQAGQLIIVGSDHRPFVCPPWKVGAMLGCGGVWPVPVKTSIRESDCGCGTRKTGDRPATPGCAPTADDPTEACRIVRVPIDNCERVPTPPRKPTEGPRRLSVSDNFPLPAFFVAATSGSIQPLMVDGRRRADAAYRLFGDSLRSTFCVWRN